MNQRRVALIIVLAGVLLVLLAAVVAGLVISSVVGAVSDREDGLSVRTEQPASVDELRDRYELDVGALELNLGDLDFPEGTTQVEARVDDGVLAVVVPRDVPVRVNAQAENGALSVFGRDSSGEDLERSYVQDGYEQAERRLSLELSVDTGAITVLRE